MQWAGSRAPAAQQPAPDRGWVTLKIKIKSRGLEQSGTSDVFPVGRDLHARNHGTEGRTGVLEQGAGDGKVRESHQDTSTTIGKGRERHQENTSTTVLPWIELPAGRAQHRTPKAVAVSSHGFP